MKIINVHALSLDGSIASNPIESDEMRIEYGLSCKDDQDHVRRLLEGSDAVITGSKSLISADSAWEVTNDKGNTVDWIVLSNKGLPDDLGFWEQRDIDRYVVSKTELASVKAKASTDERVHNLVYGDQNAAEFVVEYLKAKNAQQVLLFGGGNINKLFFEGNLVTHIEYTICPVILGNSDRVNVMAPGENGPYKAKLLHTSIDNNYVFLSYELDIVNPILK